MAPKGISHFDHRKRLSPYNLPEAPPHAPECPISYKSQTEEFSESTDFIPESPILIRRVRCSQYVLFPLSPRTIGLSDIHVGLSDNTNRQSFNVYLNTPSCMFNIMSCIHKYLIHGHIYRYVISERRPMMFQAMGSLLIQ